MSENVNVCKLSEIKWADNKLLKILKDFKGETIETEGFNNDPRHSRIEYLDDDIDIKDLLNTSNKLKKAEQRLIEKKERFQLECTHPAEYVYCYQHFYRDESDYPTRFYVSTTLECTICGKKTYAHNEQ